ncbi:unnamed protein product [Penicillium nalgiovense]|nr:unnamed protein product [Penicillium nalgiovense]
MLAGLYQDQVRNTDQKAKAVKVYEGKTSLQYSDTNPPRLDSRKNTPDIGANAGFNHIIGHPQRLNKPKLSQYHLEAHHKATPYLYTLYFTLVDNPFVGFYKPIPESQVPPKAARDAIRELDRWQSLIEKWKSILSVLNNTRQPGEPETKPMMLALSDMCKEYDYPNAWASLPPRGPAETHRVNKIKIE